MIIATTTVVMTMAIIVVASRASTVTVAPISAAVINNGRSGVVRGGLIDNRGGICTVAVWIDADTDGYSSIRGRSCGKRESAKNKWKNSSFHDSSLEYSRAAKVTARPMKLYFIA